MGFLSRILLCDRISHKNYVEINISFCPNFLKVELSFVSKVKNQKMLCPSCEAERTDRIKTRKHLKKEAKTKRSPHQGMQTGAFVIANCKKRLSDREHEAVLSMKRSMKSAARGGKWASCRASSCAIGSHIKITQNTVEIIIFLSVVLRYNLNCFLLKIEVTLIRQQKSDEA